MNATLATETAKSMVAILRNAGFEITERETETEYEFTAQNKMTNIYDVTYTFGGLVWKSEVTNRAKKNFTVVRSDLNSTEVFRKVTTKMMWIKIETALMRKITTADIYSTKVGA